MQRHRPAGMEEDEMNDGGPAFSRPCGTNSFADSPASLGMSLRDFFAGKAVQAYSTQICEETGEWTTDMIAASCYRLADAMLKEREK